MLFFKIFSTIFLGFIFTFLNQEVWGKLVTKLKGLGGIIAATLIPGTMWLLGHGLSHPMINQFGLVWVDMAWAPAIGGITHSLLIGKKNKKLNNLLAAVFAGILAGYLLA